jgi:succinate dehydrogenase (ubiquinone) membrane anchor subunit
MLDATLGGLLIAHSHIGLGACITDYIPKRKYGVLHDASVWALYAGTALAVYGLYEYETNDVGLSETIRKIWNA